MKKTKRKRPATYPGAKSCDSDQEALKRLLAVDLGEIRTYAVGEDFPEGEYDFRKLMNEERSMQRAAWFYELDREFGNTNLDPFLKLTPEEQKLIVAKYTQKIGRKRKAIESISLHSFEELSEQTDLDSSNALDLQETYTSIHIIRVNWLFTKKEILDAFWNWWKSSPEPSLPARSPGFGQARGNTVDYGAWLGDLGIYRLDRYYGRKEGKKKVSRAGLTDSKWRRAVKNTEERLRGMR